MINVMHPHTRYSGSSPDPSYLYLHTGVRLPAPILYTLTSGEMIAKIPVNHVVTTTGSGPVNFEKFSPDGTIVISQSTNLIVQRVMGSGTTSVWSSAGGNVTIINSGLPMAGTINVTSGNPVFELGSVASGDLTIRGKDAQNQVYLSSGPFLAPQAATTLKIGEFVVLRSDLTLRSFGGGSLALDGCRVEAGAAIESTLPLSTLFAFVSQIIKSGCKPLTYRFGFGRSFCSRSDGKPNHHVHYKWWCGSCTAATEWLEQWYNRSEWNGCARI